MFYGSLDSTSEAALLQVENLRVSFGSGSGKVHAVRGVDIFVRPGEIVALVGESGSGKSTIGLSLLGLLDRTSQSEVTGQAWFRDKKGQRLDLLSLPAHQMRELRGNHVAMVFQEPNSSLNPLYTIGRQIVESIRQHQNVGRGEARDKALSLLETLGLPNPRNCFSSYPHQLSGGMRQRVMIAIALACEPSLLIADEPTTALDVTIQAQIVDLLQRIQDLTDMSIIFITHDLALVAEIAHRAVVLYAGEVVESASTDTLISSPKMPYTRALLDAIPHIGCSEVADYRLRTVAGTAPSWSEAARGCAFAARCSHARADCREHIVPLESVNSDTEVRCLHWRELDLRVGS